MEFYKKATGTPRLRLKSLVLFLIALPKGTRKPSSKTDYAAKFGLESEGNKDKEYDKYKLVDILVKWASDELMLVEVQNDSEIDYFQHPVSR